MRAVHEVMACGLVEAKDALEALPGELLIDVSARYAEDAVAALQAAGCDAEAVAPRR
jgi:ribosomal protein L7/L12